MRIVSLITGLAVFVLGLSSSLHASNTFDLTEFGVVHQGSNGVYRIEGGTFDQHKIGTIRFIGSRTDTFEVDSDELQAFLDLLTVETGHVVGFIADGDFNRADFTLSATSVLDSLSFTKGQNTYINVLFTPDAGVTNYRRNRERRNGFRLSNNNNTNAGNVFEQRVQGADLQTAVPEPGTWFLMIAGFVLVGFGVKNRRGSLVAAR